MSNWNELKRPFRDALIGAFSVDELDEMLRYHCDHELEQLAGRDQARKKIVDDVIAHAVRAGWRPWPKARWRQTARTQA